MRYIAYFLCDVCGHKWKTYYDRLKSLERGMCARIVYSALRTARTTQAML